MTNYLDNVKKTIAAEGSVYSPFAYYLGFNTDPDYTLPEAGKCVDDCGLQKLMEVHVKEQYAIFKKIEDEYEKKVAAGQISKEDKPADFEFIPISNESALRIAEWLDKQTWNHENTKVIVMFQIKDSISRAANTLFENLKTANDIRFLFKRFSH